MPSRPKLNTAASALLKWYDRHRRVMPWRALPGAHPDPYAVWLSEIMLQQTTVGVVKPYFEKFLARWPRVQDLAKAKTEDVMAAWAGLGYYARARNLHKCAQVIVAAHGGRFPGTEEELLTLPGVGPYTAAAITAIAFDRHAVVVDGNVERVMARLHAVSEPLPRSKPKLYALAARLTPDKRFGDYAQAVMDLGATICTPKSPACILCPWANQCRAPKQGIATELPRKEPKKATPTRHGVVFWVQSNKGDVLLHRRPPKGLLGGMLAFPSTEWRATRWTKSEAQPSAPVKKKWSVLPGVVEHTFTHFHLKLEVWVSHVALIPKLAQATWVPRGEVTAAGLPNVMQKVARHVLNSATKPSKTGAKRSPVPRDA